MAQALVSSGPVSSGLNDQVNFREGANGGINIRGMGGPYKVRAQNFALGTTAADIESVMSGIGGELLSCRIVASNPTVMADLIFADKVGAENVVTTFNNKKVCLCSYLLR